MTFPSGPRSVSFEVFEDRAVAAIVGLGIGDAMGDLGRDDEVRSRYGVLTELLPQGRSTDDTEFCVLSARSYLDCAGQFTSKVVADSWRRLVLASGGPLDRGGIPLYGAFWNLSQGIDPPLSGSDNVLHDDDGAAMRAVPFGILAAGDPKEAARLAIVDATVSHSRDGIYAAAAVAASISVALVGAPVDEVIAAGESQIPRDCWLGRRMELAMKLVDSASDVFDIYAKLHSQLWTPKHSIAAEAIPQMYGLYKLAAGDFRKGLIMAANFGRDADTICALVVALSAAGRGTSIFPSEWVERVRTPSGVCLPFTANEDLVDLGKELAARALADHGGR
jgi:ADP-ribosylglycohydrolase